MASPHSCAALVDVFPDLLRARRTLVGTLNTPAVATLAVVHQRGSMRISEVAEHLSLDLSTVSRQVTHLRQRGMLDSSPDPDDGRSQRLTVSLEGVEELRHYRRAIVERLLEHHGDWSDHEVDDLARLLGKLATTATAECAVTPSAAASPENTELVPEREKELQANA